MRGSVFHAWGQTVLHRVQVCGDLAAVRPRATGSSPRNICVNPSIHTPRGRTLIVLFTIWETLWNRLAEFLTSRLCSYKIGSSGGCQMTSVNYSGVEIRNPKAVRSWSLG